VKELCSEKKSPAWQRGERCNVKSRAKNKRKPAKRARVKTYTRPSAETHASTPLSTQQQPGEATPSPQKARTVSTGIIPGQFAGSRIPALYRAAQPRQTAPNPYFPDLWSRPPDQNKQQGPAAVANPEETPESSASTVEGELADRHFTPHMPRSNPISATCKDGRVTVLVSSFVMDLPEGALGISSGSIGGLSKGTLYRIFFDAPDFNLRDGIVPTYNFSTSKIFAGVNGRFFVGSILTPTRDGETSIGLGDGGAGASGSTVESRHLEEAPTRSASTAVGKSDTALAPAKAEAAEEGWPEIQIAFLSDERVEICHGDSSRKTYNYGELGFEDRRNGKPNRAWVMLREIAGQNGAMPRPPQGKNRAMIQKRIEEIREKLRNHFKIRTDPIPFNGNMYRASFKISRRPSFET
jgi:hypothetical protein